MSSGFKMHKDDFPALTEYKVQADKEDLRNNTHDNKEKKQSDDASFINNLPTSVLKDPYGMVSFFMLTKLDDDSKSKARVFRDLGIEWEKPNCHIPNNLNSFCDYSAPLQDLDFNVPLEYMSNTYKDFCIPPPSFKSMNEDMLFFIFFAFPKQTIQLFAASNLHQKKWKFHKNMKIWLFKLEGQPEIQNGDEITFPCIVFDPNTWKRMERPVTVNADLKELEDKVILSDQNDNIYN